MKRVCSMMAAAVCGFAGAMECVWTGGAGDGLWSTAGNWSGNAVPGAADTAVFNSAATVSFSGTAPVGGFVFNASVTLTAGEPASFTSASENYFQIGSDGDSSQAAITVAEGVAVDFNVRLAAASPAHTHLLKEGGGKITFLRRVGYGMSFDGFEVKAGTVRFGFCQHSDGANVGAGPKLVVCNGARLEIGGSNQVYNYTVFDVRDGGLVDFGGYSDVVGGFVGSGVVTNIMTASLMLNGGPLLFAGRLYGTVGPSSQATLGADSALVVGAADTFAGATWAALANTRNTLRFAPNIGTFTFQRYAGAADAPLNLSDADGKPVTLRTGLSTDIGGQFTGPGSVVKTASATYQTVVTGAQVSVTGAFARQDALAVTFGDGQEAANNADLTQVGSLWNLGRSEFMGFANVGDLVLSPPVYGDGEFRNLGPGRVTFANLRTTNALVIGTSTVPFDISGGAWKDLTVNQTECATNTISGGEGDGLLLAPSLANGVINITGGSFTNVAIVPNNASANAYTLAFRNADVVVTNYLNGSGNRRYVVDNAKLTLTHGYTAAGGGLYEQFLVTNRASMFIQCAPTWNQGLGFSLVDGSTLVLKNSNQYNFRVASDGVAHRWHVGKGSHLQAGTAQICSPGTTGVTTGTIEVAEGGRFTLTEGGIDTPNNDHGFGALILDGGVLEMKVATGNITICNASGARFGLFVTERGATLEVTKSAPIKGDSLTASFVPYTTDGARDGGLTKLGRGYLQLSSGVENTLRGPTRLLEGNVYAYANHPYGYGDLSLANVYLTCDVLGNGTQRVADGAGSRIRVSGAPLWYMRYNSSEKATLVAGPEDAGVDSVLTADTPNAMLFLMTNYSGDPFDGTGARFLVNGGVSLTPAGLASFPAMAITASGANDRGILRFLTYDSEKGFVAAALTEGLAGGENSLANVETAAMTVSEDAHVGALRVCAQNGTALTIAEGTTLQVGDGEHPAQVILNNNNTKSSTAQIGGAGTLDFGSSRGIIAANWARANSEDAQVKVVIKGSNGVSFAGVARYYASMIGLSAANTYSGDTYIDGVQVSVSNPLALSTGDVYVQGSHAYGGGLKINTPSLANNLHVRGEGHLLTQSTEKGSGALVFARSVALGGDVEIVDYATIVSSDAAYTISFNGCVSGGDLTLDGYGTYAFNGSTVVTGAVTVASGATLRVATAEALGRGAVVNDGVLELDNASDIVVTNALSGTGKIVLAGAGKVTFTAAHAFAGVIEMGSAEQTVDIGSETLAVSALYGKGTVTGETGGTLEISGSAAGSDFAGVLSGGLALVKQGTGTQYLSGNNAYAGATDVREGTLVLGARKYSTSLTVRDALFQLDASDADTLVVNDAGEVTCWADALGGTRLFTNVVGYTAFPTQCVGAVNGRNSVWFDGDRNGVNSALFSAAPATGVKTVFGVFRTSSASHPKSWSCAGVFGSYKNDAGLRLNGSGAFNAGNNWTENSSYRVNGAVASTFQAATATVWSVELATARNAGSGLAVGDYWGNAKYLRCLYGELCELIVYDRVLDATETDEVTTYLEKKWRNEPDPTGATLNVLPATTAVNVGANAVLDLAGVTQTVAELAGAGVVRDSSGTSAALTVTDSLADFTGTLSALTLAVPANAVLALNASATIDPSCSIRLGAKARLDLGGQTVTVLNASGTGRVVNGTLVVTGSDTRHDVGTLMLFR